MGYPPSSDRWGCLRGRACGLRFIWCRICPSSACRRVLPACGEQGVGAPILPRSSPLPARGERANALPSKIGHFHHRLGVARTGSELRRDQLAEFICFSVGEFDLGRADIVLDIADLARTGNRHDEIALM